MSSASHSKRRIVVLGGGMGSMAAVWALTEDPSWRQRYDITVYQMGWRLGGKGASGRNPQHAQRIEEHGLHIWLGFYDNAFSILRRCYQELGRPAGAPLARCEEAFSAHSYVGVSGSISSHRRWFWLIDAPRNQHVPGSPEAPLRRRDYLRQGLRLLASVLKTPSDTDRDERQAIAQARLQLAELSLAALRGLIRDRALLFGLDVLDSHDLRNWLCHHGARKEATETPFLKGFYDLAFAYEDGDPNRPNFAAGAALRAILRTLFSYKGSVFWKMQAGMGDVVFAPLYEVLRRRGVRFEFFHRVEEVRFAAGSHGEARQVTQLRLCQQATVRSGAYDPLIDVDGLPCWPSVPRYEQLVERELLAQQGADLECPWDPWPGVGSVCLQRGKDFDDVIFGISLGAVPALCPSLIADDRRWREMTQHVRTVATQAAQLWFRSDLAALGWSRPSPVLDAYDDPLNTWADMTFLLPRETWPRTNAPRSLAYLVGPLPDSGAAEPGPAGREYLQLRRAQVRTYVRHWLSHSAAGLFPRTAQPEVPSSFDWQCLHDPEDRSGAERLDALYLRTNVAPSERYVQSIAGSTLYRVFSEDAGVAGFYPVGDWVNTGINSGDIEAATISGLQAARGILAQPRTIVGEGDGAARYQIRHTLHAADFPTRRCQTDRPGRGPSATCAAASIR